MNNREDLKDKICMMLISKGIDVSEIKDELYIIMEKYEIGERSTEIAVLQEDRNEYLLRKFLIGKTVAGLSDNTIRVYKNYLEFILTRIGKTVDDIEADDIRFYLAMRQKKDSISKTSANNELRALKTFYSYLTTEELIEKNPTLKIPKIKCDKKKKKAFTELEIEQMRECLKCNREKAMFEILLSTWCRVSELVQIRIDEIEDDHIIVHGKGAKDRLVYFNARAIIAIKNYLDERSDDNPYLFCGGKSAKTATYARKDGRWYVDPELVSDGHIDKGTVEALIRKIQKRSKIQSSAYPHKFRRTGATFALRRGMPIEQVSKMLGHESISTTQIYLDLNEEDLKQSHKKYVG